MIMRNAIDAFIIIGLCILFSLILGSYLLVIGFYWVAGINFLVALFNMFNIYTLYLKLKFFQHRESKE
jgi:hypothetical protein